MESINEKIMEGKLRWFGYVDGLEEKIICKIWWLLKSLQKLINL